MNDFNGKRTAVTVSGGVDSLYSLVSLRENYKGADIFALHALFLPARLRGTEYDRMLAVLRTGCERIGVELHIVDCSAEFARLVMRPFAASYFAGCTPNPCAACNRDIKFGLLWDKAAALGADLMVTGHYARLEFDAQGAPMLLNGRDIYKDQSYFLALTPLEQLARVRFPLGDKRKSDIVAELDERNRRAADLALSASGDRAVSGGGAGNSTGSDNSDCAAGSGNEAGVASIEQAGNSANSGNSGLIGATAIEVPVKDESQEICFIPGNDYRAFLAEQAALDPELAAAGQRIGNAGDMLLPDGRVVGKHKGLWAYTEGQRKGLGVAWSEPLYVLGKDLERNALLLGTASDLNSRFCLCGNLNFLLPPEEWPAVVYAKTRYRQAMQPAKVEFSDSGQMRIEFVDSQPSAPAAPGQVAAIYMPYGINEDGGEAQDFRLLAGGEIQRSR
ncbi:tRNA 2-thiouridine(34) synthase MnmA [Desulfovibrio sp. OttesenSCG-928-C06]|nr:tRNA 2-thiouridine(34) synthase MnmA [Desulfovibrio sp. OttesenSCG-928-C06]